MDASSATGTIQFEQTNDPTNAVAGVPAPYYPSYLPSPALISTIISNGASTANTYAIPITAKYLRARAATGFTAGTQRLVMYMSMLPPQMRTTTISTGGNAIGTGGSNFSLGVGGNAGHSSAVAGNPVQTGGCVTTTLDTTLVNGDASRLMLTSAGQLIIKPNASAENDFTYAAASGGITNTTAVTLKAAGAANIKNKIDFIDLSSTALGVATEVAIRDGAAGTVLWRGYIGMGGQTLTRIPVNVRGSSATLIEFVALTAITTGAIYVNAQGHQEF